MGYVVGNKVEGLPLFHLLAYDESKFTIFRLRLNEKRLFLSEANELRRKGDWEGREGEEGDECVLCLTYLFCGPSREGWEARALLGFFEAKRRAKDSINRQLRNSRRPPPRRRRYEGGWGLALVEVILSIPIPGPIPVPLEGGEGGKAFLQVLFGTHN